MKVKVKVLANEYRDDITSDEWCYLRADLITNVYWVGPGVFQAELSNGSEHTISDETGKMFIRMGKIIELHEKLTLQELEKHIVENELGKARKNGTA